MSTGAVVLKDVVLNSAGGFDELLGYRLDSSVGGSASELSQHPQSDQVIPGSR